MSLFRSHRTLLSHSSRQLLITNRHFPSYLKMSFRDYSNIETPASCYVDFCLVPVGTGNVSVANEVAEVQRILKASGLKYTMHSAGTTVEGSWDEVMKVIGQAHAVVHQGGVKRVQTSMRVGTRTDKKQTAEDKVKRVQGILSEDQKGESSA
ncbi:YkoF-like protein [Neurospora tetraspora]|uniref:YkoF-like protein n=1 Tax=Neurospora tetraspora TaxID=94610 RepID=A0AAE0JA33_9PEZI|nr:YkoF-like protein [Neurospora tetraspora]